MKDRKYLYLLVLISIVILTTLSIQVYWNYKNYKDSKRQLIADVQTSLDQSVDDYFTSKAKENTMGIFFNGSIKDGALDKVFERIDSLNKNNIGKKSSLTDIETDQIKGITVLKGADKDSMDRFEDFLQLKTTRRYETKLPDSLNLERLKINDSSLQFKSDRFYRFPVDTSKSLDSNLKLSDSDTLKFSYKLKEEVSSITNRIVLSMTDDTVETEEIDSIFHSRLNAKKIDLNYQMFLKPEKAENTLVDVNLPFKATANTSLIKNERSLSVYYGDLTTEVLKRNLTGILLSFLLVASVIFCLFYLLVVINNQKELSSMKNDLISNITHEFKTPIATAGAALEGVQSFTASGDTEKTDRYLAMGREQLTKLNIMVEKLLETATLDSKDLALQKTDVNIADLLQNSVTRFQGQTEKTIAFKQLTEHITSLMADQFHLENAFNNLIDNAVKYGGEKIEVTLNSHGSNLLVEVTDNGTGLDAKHAKRLFEKFYRVGSGNKHNVKGFGIGLFYTQAIIEKHNGAIALEVKPTTSFKITLPYE